MQTKLNELSDNCQSVAGETQSAIESVTRRTLDKTLTELKSSRRLENLISSIESFLLSQVTRVEESLEKCHGAVNQNQILQRMMVDFEEQKAAWEEERLAEEKRLFDAGEKLIQAWKKLEEERLEFQNQTRF